MGLPASPSSSPEHFHTFYLEGSLVLKFIEFRCEKGKNMTFNKNRTPRVRHAVPEGYDASDPRGTVFYSPIDN